MTYGGVLWAKIRFLRSSFGMDCESNPVDMRVQAHYNRLREIGGVRMPTEQRSADLRRSEELLAEARLAHRDGELRIAEGYKTLSRSSDLDCDPEVKSRRIRDGYLALSDGHSLLAKSDEMVAEAGRLRMGTLADALERAEKVIDEHESPPRLPGQS